MSDSKCYKFNGAVYAVYRDGTIIGKRGELKHRLNRDGYLMVTIGTNEEGRSGRLVHRIVAELFVPNPNNLPEVNHKDYNRQNPSADNLEWISRIDNVQYSSKTGSYSNSKKGFKNGKSSYDINQIIKMRDMYKDGYGIMDIIKYIFPELTYKQRKNKWNAIKDICIGKSYKEIN